MRISKAYFRIIHLALLMIVRICVAQELVVSDVSMQDKLLFSGDRIVVKIDLQNSAENPLRLSFDVYGRVLGVTFELLDDTGASISPVDSKLLSEQGVDGGLPGPFAELPSGATLSVHYDLTAIFGIKKPGDYSIKWADGPNNWSVKKFTIHEIELKSEISVKATCMSWPEGSIFGGLDNDGRIVSCIVSTMPIPVEQKSAVLIHGIQCNGAGFNSSPRQVWFTVPDGVTVESLVLDVKWDLWLLLQAGDEVSLWRVNLNSLLVETVVDWTQKGSVSLQRSRQAQFSNAFFAIASRENRYFGTGSDQNLR